MCGKIVEEVSAQPVPLWDSLQEVSMPSTHKEWHPCEGPQNTKMGFGVVATQEQWMNDTCHWELIQFIVSFPLRKKLKGSRGMGP